MNDSLLNQTKKSNSKAFTLVLISILVGIGSGFLGMSLDLILHFIQRVAYGYNPTQLINNDGFLAEVSASSSERRVLVLCICGLIAGLGWWLVYHLGKPLVSIQEALKTGKKMPLLSTISHIFLQMITIALGSPLGREVAPREAGALFANWISGKAGLSVEDTKIMLACGAGAGLAAVYNVPLGGAVFVIEVLLCTYSPNILLPALLSSGIATVISWWGLGHSPTYSIPDLSLSSSLIIWSIFSGPIFGFFAFWFHHIALIQRQKALHDWNMMYACLLNFLFIGCLAIYFPILLGNGKSPAQMEFMHSLGIGLSTLLLALRCLITWTSLRCGAQGGLLTPSLANGALLAVILGGCWNIVWPSGPLEAYAVIGAAAFLAAAQEMPLAAIVLIVEFTRVNLDFLVPIMFAVYGAVLTFNYCKTNNLRYQL